jgi:hypothetical protein
MTTLAGITKDGEEVFNFRSSKDISAEIRGVTPEQMRAATQELTRISRTARDYIVPGRKLNFTTDDDQVVMNLELPGGFGAWARLSINNTAHTHLSQKLNIAGPYYTRMRREYPELLAHNLNAWAQRESSSFMIRELDGHVRAVLGDRYKAVDGASFFLHAGKQAVEMGAVLSKIEVTEEQMAFRAILPEFGAKIIDRGNQLAASGKMFASGYKRDDGTWQGPDADDPRGEWIFPAIVGLNNDIGNGRFGCYLSAFAIGCSNYIMAGTHVAKVHRGGKQDEGLIDYSEGTRAIADQLLWAEIGDMVTNAFDPEKWQAVVQKMIAMQDEKLDNPIEAVKAVSTYYNLNEDTADFILNELISPRTRDLDPGRTVYGLLQAITSPQHEVPLASALQLEHIGGDFIDNYEKVLATPVPVKKSRKKVTV